MMPDKPAAEVPIDDGVVRHLVATQVAPILEGVRGHSPWKYAEGWDCEVWRLGTDVALRLPRRAAAAPLIRNEWRSLEVVGPALEAAGISVPTPMVRGVPDARYPWHWSVVPWVKGDRGLDIPRADRSGWAETLANALATLHVPAPADHPMNPHRGRPLTTRASAFSDRLALLRDRGAIGERVETVLSEAWTAGVRAPQWNAPPVWIHGDLHPGNLVADGPALRGLIDFGDVTGGDPAYDLAVAWLAFERRGRDRFIAATAARYDQATWIRARAWAAAVAVMLLANSDDEPDYAALGRESAIELAEGL